MIYPERVRWIEVPAEVRGALEPMLVFWLPLLPSWVEDFIVRYHGSKPKCLEVSHHYTNRWASLHATGEWLDLPDVEREAALLHELAHVCVAPMDDSADRVLNSMTIEGGTERRMGEKIIEHGVEAVVEDLARGMQRLFRSKVAPVAP